MKVKAVAKTIWKGQVAIRDKFVNKLREEGTDTDELVIRHEKEYMTIPKFMLDQKIRMVSKDYFKDKFGRPSHKLVYFLWEPDTVEKKIQSQRKAEVQPSLF
jgi:hypothetical protein